MGSGQNNEIALRKACTDLHLSVKDTNGDYGKILRGEGGERLRSLDS